MKVLVVYDVQVKAPDVFQVPLVINYGKPLFTLDLDRRCADKPCSDLLNYASVHV